MLWHVRIVLGLLVGLACVQAVNGQGRPKRPAKATVELRWVEAKRVEGLTEDEGFQDSCDPKSIVFPHKKPALVLTAAEVAEVSLVQHDLSQNGLSSENYLVTIHLTKEARDKLAAAVKGQETKLITVDVDGWHWGVLRYEKDQDKPFVPAPARAQTFTPEVGYFSSKFEAQRVVDALK